MTHQPPGRAVAEKQRELRVGGEGERTREESGERERLKVRKLKEGGREFLDVQQFVSLLH